MDLNDMPLKDALIDTIKKFWKQIDEKI